MTNFNEKNNKLPFHVFISTLPTRHHYLGSHHLPFEMIPVDFILLFHLLKSILSIKARFTFIKPVCLKFLFEFSPFSLINICFCAIPEVPRFIFFVRCSKYALMILSCNYVLDKAYGLFHYISRWTV